MYSAWTLNFPSYRDESGASNQLLVQVDLLVQPIHIEHWRARNSWNNKTWIRIIQNLEQQKDFPQQTQFFQLWKLKKGENK